jgi:nitrite reductase (NO-forming)
VKRRHRLLIATAVVLVVALGGLAAFALAGGFDKTTTQRLTGGGTKVVRVALVDATVGFDVTPDVVVVDPGTHLILDVVNDGDEVHDLAVDGGSSRTRMLDPGESQRLDLGRVSADIRALCTLPGHELAGMSLAVQVDER